MLVVVSYRVYIYVAALGTAIHIVRDMHVRVFGIQIL
jgi:hypothetical protein